MKRKLALNSKIITAIVLLLAAPLLMARDELVIDIIDGVESALPIAVIPFKWEGTGPAPDTVVSLVVKDDLARSGQFRALKEADLIEQPTRLADIRFSTWRLLQVDYLVVGRVLPDGDGYAVEYQLIDVVSTKRLQGFRFQVSKGKLRRTAHQIADRIFEEILGIPGAFNTLIAYVTQDERLTEAEYKLMVADADGFNPRQALSSSEPILSPAWSPDGTRLAYVSFQTGNSNVYVQQISTGNRERVASFQGINGAPSWSPDGKSLALALSRTGNLEIYVMDFATRSLRQLTKHRSIDTEPIWTPDGSRIIFTSDRGGRPQLYEIPVDGGRARRLTFDRDYNARASISPDGKKIAMASGQNNDYRIAVLDKTSGRTQIVTPGFLDESPSFSPNGVMILYASHEGDQDILAAVSTDGRVRQRLILTDVDVREPAWSPRLR